MRDDDPSKTAEDPQEQRDENVGRSGIPQQIESADGSVAPEPDAEIDDGGWLCV
jgi:hypothetical protein